MMLAHFGAGHEFKLAPVDDTAGTGMPMPLMIWAADSRTHDEQHILQSA